MYLTATPAPTLPAPTRFRGAPSLAGLEDSGALPPVEERLPENPLVVPVEESIGEYGGAWRMVIQSVADEAQFIRTVAYEPLVRWTKDWSGIEPNLVEWYRANEDATEFTFKLRRGLRWSDGTPFSTLDIRFWYEDVLLNPELTPVIPNWITSRGQVARFVFEDEVTFHVQFTSSNTLFLQYLATPEALPMTAYPRYYARKYHASYVPPAELERMVEEGGYETWAEMFIDRVGVKPTDSGNFIDPQRPRLTAWVLSTPYKPGVSEVRWERNPYYWKVDEKGNQLPYINSVIFTTIGSLDEAINRSVSGSVNMQNITRLGIDSALIADHIERQRMRLLPMMDGSNNVMVINFNISHNDPTKRSLFRNKSFRIALSLAINRQEILDFIYGGEGVPWQAAPRPESPFFDPVMGAQHTEYNPEKANQFLDAAGLGKDQVGNRLGPDGSPISFSVLVLDNQPQQIAMLNMISKYWSEIGINMQPQVEPLPLYMATVQSNLHEAAAWTGGSTFFSDVLLDPSNYMPSGENALWAIHWANWFNKIPGYENIVPDPAARKSLEMYDRIHSVRDPAEQMRLMKGALLVARESFWTIGIARGPDPYTLVSGYFKNVPERIPASWLYPDPAPARPEQFYIASVQ